MSKNKKILIGLLTLSPIIGMFLYFICFIFMFSMIPTEVGAGQNLQNPTSFLGAMGTAMIILLITIFLSLAMTIYYIIHVVNNKQLDHEKSENIIWVLLILIAGPMGQLVYWYMKIWKENLDDSAVTTTID